MLDDDNYNRYVDGVLKQRVRGVSDGITYEPLKLTKITTEMWYSGIRNKYGIN